MTNKQAYAGLLKRLRSMAKSSSEAQRIMAQAKTARQTDRDDYPELASTGYSWTAPEETAEWQAAEAISSLLKRVGELEGLLETAHGAVAGALDDLRDGGYTVSEQTRLDLCKAWAGTSAALNSDAPLSIGEGL